MPHEVRTRSSLRKGSPRASTRLPSDRSQGAQHRSHIALSAGPTAPQGPCFVTHARRNPVTHLSNLVLRVSTTGSTCRSMSRRHAAMGEEILLYLTTARRWMTCEGVP